ncbi:MAG: ParB N-terminal domain-containing protein [Sphaerochaeta sp.]
MKTRFEKVDPKSLRLLERNARYMKHEEFQRLVSNIKEDGCLTSVPLCCQDKDKGLTVLSGNHRVMAAIEAGFEKIDVMVIQGSLSEQKRIAIQLSHNAIVGQDDYAILKELFDCLDVESKKYSGLDDKTLKLLDQISQESFHEPNLDVKFVSLCFFPKPLEQVKRILEESKSSFGADETWAVYGQDWERYLDMMETSQAVFGIKNLAVAFHSVLRLVESHPEIFRPVFLTADSKQDKTKMIPVHTLFGTNKCTQGTAKLIEKCKSMVIGRGDLKGEKDEWKILEVILQEWMDAQTKAVPS